MITGVITLALRKPIDTAPRLSLTTPSQPVRVPSAKSNKACSLSTSSLCSNNSTDSVLGKKPQANI